jgi:adenylate cyclase
MGYLDQAIKQTQESLRLGREVSHAVSQAYALTAAAQHHQIRRDSAQVGELARAAQELSTEHGLAYFSAWGKLLLARTTTEQEPSAGNIVALRSIIDALRAMGTDSLVTYALYLLAEAYGWAEQPAAGLAVIAEALLLVEKNGARFGEAELYRLRGELLRQEGAAEAEVEACFHRAIEIAQRQEANRYAETCGRSVRAGADGIEFPTAGRWYRARRIQLNWSSCFSFGSRSTETGTVPRASASGWPGRQPLADARGTVPVYQCYVVRFRSEAA